MLAQSVVAAALALLGWGLARALARQTGGRWTLASAGIPQPPPAVAASATETGGLGGNGGDGGLFRLALYTMAGAVALHLLLTGLDLAGLGWNPAVVAAAWAAALGLALFLGRRPALPPASRSRALACAVGWGDGIALAALLVFTLFALTLWTATPDFVYHWGLKGHRFYLDRGIDYAYLGQKWNWVLHPDYPNLLPELYALTAFAGGRWDERAMMLWSAGFYFLLLGAVRETLRQGGCSRFTLQATTALVALVVTAASIRSPMAGGADWMIALSLAAAMPPLARPADRTGDLQIGLIAAFAAASKVEGVPLAGFLILLQWARPGRGGATLAAVVRLTLMALPVTAVAAPWLVQVYRHRLFQDYNTGPFDPSRARAVGRALLAMIGARYWHGFSYAPFLLPLLAWDRRVRRTGAVIFCQLLFYLYVFFSANVDPVLLVQTSLPRLLLHVLPATLVGAAMVLDGWARPPPAGPGPP